MDVNDIECCHTLSFLSGVCRSYSICSYGENEIDGSLPHTDVPSNEPLMINMKQQQKRLVLWQSQMHEPPLYLNWNRARRRRRRSQKQLFKTLYVHKWNVLRKREKVLEIHQQKSNTKQVDWSVKVDWEENLL